MKRLLKTIILRTTRASMATAGVLFLIGAVMLTIAACSDDSGSDGTPPAFVCANGTAADGATSDTDGDTKCTSCDEGYILEGDACVVAHDNVCQHGTPVAGDTSQEGGANKCASCDDGYILDGDACVVAYNYSCPNGTPAAGKVKDQNTVQCSACDDNYQLNDITNACDSVALDFTSQPTKDGDGTANTATIILTTNKDAIIHWVVYADGEDAPDAATVVADAASNAGVDNSGQTGESATAGKPVTISVSGLSANTDYDFYAAALIADPQELIVSEKYDFQTTAAGVPTFTQPPQASNITRNGATVNLTVDENVTLYWVVYSGQQTDLTASKLIADATSSSGVISGANISVSADTPHSVSVSGLQPLNDYHFYAAIVDTDDNQNRSSELPVSTIGWTYVCDGGTPTPGTDATNGSVTKCSACDNGLAPNTDAECEELLAFSNQPALDVDVTRTANTASVTLTVNKDATVYWVLYDEGADAPTATELITSAGDTDIATGRRSGADGVDAIAGESLSVAISGLTATTNYDFYAVASATDPTETLVSNKLDLLTTDAGVASFSSAPAASGITRTEATITLAANEAVDLYWVLYDTQQTSLSAAQLIAHATGTSTDNGEVKRGANISIDAGDTQQISVSDLEQLTDYYFYAAIVDGDNNQTRSTELPFATIGYPYICAGGTAAEGTVSETNAVNRCASCNNGLAPNSSFACEEKLAIDSQPALDANVPVTANTASVTLTVNKDATVYWVVYDEGADTPTATELITSAGDTNIATGRRSGENGVVAKAGEPLSIAVSALTATTNYDFYAVARATDPTETLLSSKLDILTTAAGVPSFTAAPVAASTSRTGAVVTLTPSEAVTLHWVVYDSQQTNLTVADLIAAAKGTGTDNGEVKRGADISVTTTDPNDPQTITISGLDQLSSYYFYAAIVDLDSNQTRSTELPFSTIGWPYICPLGTEVADTDSATQDIVKCASCDGTNVQIGDQCYVPFTRAENGVTITCAGYDNGTKGVVDGVIYTKRTTGIHADNGYNSCITGTTNLGFSSGIYEAITSTTNLDIAHWDTSSVTNMDRLFTHSSGINYPDLGNWDVSQVTSMSGMFQGVDTYNYDLSNWCVSKISSKPTNFDTGASAWEADHKPRFGTNAGNLCDFGFLEQPQDNVENRGDTSAVFELAVNKAATVHWVLYNDGAPTPTAATVKADAANSAKGVARSGDSGETAEDDKVLQIPVSGLTADTTYDFYAVASADGEDDVLSSKFELNTRSSVASFTTQPTLSAATLTGATITLTVDEDATIHWVIYDSQQTGLTANVLRNAATGSGGVLRSGSNTVTATANMPVTITISDGDLSVLTDYHFYAASENNDDNSVLSAELPFSTIGYDFVCNGGTAVDPSVEQSETQGVTKCASCNNFFKPNGDACVPTIYTCAAGTGTVASGNPSADNDPDLVGTLAANADVEKCGSCNNFFKPNGGACVPTIYTCAAGTGTVASGNPSADNDPDLVGTLAANADVEKCSQCNPYHKPDGGACVATKYTCTNGIADTSTPADENETVTNADIERCTGCTAPYHFSSAGECSFMVTVHTDDDNNVIGRTLSCSAAVVGDTATIDLDGGGGDYGSETYTKRTSGITAANAALSCISDTTSLYRVFYINTSFNGDITHWDTSSVTNMEDLFAGATSFKQDIGNWDTSSVTNMEEMFYNADAFNQDIGGWNTGEVRDMERVFADTDLFDQNIGGWNTANVTTMRGMFNGADDFNQDISGWNTAKVTDMLGMFQNTGAFDQPISGWNTAKVRDMADMFRDADAFNRDLNWNTAEVTDMSYMFSGATMFNGDISGWNTAKVTAMRRMFADASAFNQDISGWNTAEVTNMVGMFINASMFDQNLHGWCVEDIGSTPNIFTVDSTKSPDWADDEMPQWGLACPTNPAYTCSNGAVSGDSFPTGYYHNIEKCVVGGCDMNYHNNGDRCVADFVVTDVIISCDANAEGDSHTINGVTYTKRTSGITAANAAQSCISGITSLEGLFSGSSFNGNITHWDTSDVTTMESMFHNASAFNQDIGKWDTAKVTTMRQMFDNADAFNQDISGWDTGEVTNMGSMFANTAKFNQDLGASAADDWDTSSVTDMDNMFHDALAFNGDISKWNTANVTDMSFMFRDTAKFDSDISAWDVTSVTDMKHMFRSAAVFNQDIGVWNVNTLNDHAGTLTSNPAPESLMSNMFGGAALFDQDLSGWCVSNIGGQPGTFVNDDNAAGWTVARRPQWGTSAASCNP